MSVQRRRSKTVAALTVGCLVALTSCGTNENGDDAENGAADETVTLKLAHVLSPQGVEHGVLEDIVEQVHEESDGTLVLELYPSGQLGTTEDLMEQASSGEPVVSFVDAATLAQFNAPELEILSGPFLFESEQQAQQFAESDVMGELIEPISDANIHVLALNWFDGARHVFGQEPYPEPSDLEGVRLRTPPADAWVDTFDLIGAVPTSIDAGETYSALEQGVVEAAEGPINGTAANQWEEQAKQVTLTGHFLLFLGFGMSEQVYQELSDEHQEILTNAFLEGGQTATAEHAETTVETLADMESRGIEVHEANLEAYQEKTLPFYDQFPDGLLDRVRTAAE